MGWVLKAATELDGKKFDVIAPLKPVAPGEYSLGRSITLSDHDAFIAIGTRGYKAARFRD